MENNNTTSPSAPQPLYLHFEVDGNLFLMLGSGEIIGWITDLDRLRSELRTAKEAGAMVLLSIGVVEDDVDTTLLDGNLDVIDASGVQVRTVDPHPAVYDYSDSYARYLVEAIEVAQMDVHGLASKIYDSEVSLAGCQPGTDLHGAWLTFKEDAKTRLERAQMVLQRLSDIEFELRPLPKEQES